LLNTFRFEALAQLATIIKKHVSGMARYRPLQQLITHMVKPTELLKVIQLLIAKLMSTYREAEYSEQTEDQSSIMVSHDAS